MRDPLTYVDVEWARKLPREWERLLDAAKRAKDLRLLFQILSAMTAMTPLSSERRQSIPSAGASVLPSHIDLSKLSTDELKELLKAEETPKKK